MKTLALLPLLVSSALLPGCSYLNSLSAPDDEAWPRATASTAGASVPSETGKHSIREAVQLMAQAEQRALSWEVQDYYLDDPKPVTDLIRSRAGLKAQMETFVATYNKAAASANHDNGRQAHPPVLVCIYPNKVRVLYSKGYADPC